jgi:hypothetical protein
MPGLPSDACPDVYTAAVPLGECGVVIGRGAGGEPGRVRGPEDRGLLGRPKSTVRGCLWPVWPGASRARPAPEVNPAAVEWRRQTSTKPAALLALNLIKPKDVVVTVVHAARYSPAGLGAHTAAPGAGSRHAHARGDQQLVPEPMMQHQVEGSPVR